MHTLLLCLIPLVAAEEAPEPGSDAEAEARFVAAVDAMVAADAALRDATFTLYKREYADGAWQPEAEIAVRYRAPMEMYLRWSGEVSEGQEVIYRQGWNEGRVRVNPGSLMPNLDLDPTGRVAMRGNRKTVYHLPPSYAIGCFRADAELIAGDAALDADVTYRGVEMVYGEPADCFDVTLPKTQAPSLYASKVELCLNKRTNLPARIQAWDVADGAMRQVEFYGYEGLVVNPGLSDADFDPDNPEYGF